MEPISYDKLPPHLRDGARRYIERGVLPGSGLLSMLENRPVFQAVTALDDECLAQIRDIVKWLYNDVPGMAWGSPEKVAAWSADRRQRVMQAAE